jgi:hypothetical protein
MPGGRKQDDSGDLCGGLCTGAGWRCPIMHAYMHTWLLG